MGNSTYLFVVDTGEYAGNFERAMFAHLTGQVFRYYHGYSEQLQKETHKKNNKISDWLNKYFEDTLLLKDDDSGSASAFCLLPSGYSVGVRFKERPITHVIHLMTKRAVEFCKRGRCNIGEKLKIPFIGCRLIKTTETQEVETIA
jgi:hypothetical protein